MPFSDIVADLEVLRDKAIREDYPRLDTLLSAALCLIRSKREEYAQHTDPELSAAVRRLAGEPR
jgi:hypothetical protein